MSSIIKLLVVPIAVIIFINTAFLLYLNTLSSKVLPTINKLEDVEHLLSVSTDTRSKLNEFLISDISNDSLRYFEAVEHLDQEVNHLITSYPNFFDDPAKLKSMVEDFKVSLNKLYELSSENEDLNNEVIFGLNLEITSRFQAIENYLIGLNSDANEILLADMNDSENMGYLLVVVSLLLSVVATVVIYYQLVKPLRLLSKQLKNLSEGKYPTIEIERSDEIGQLIQAFNETSKSLYHSEQELINTNRQLKIANQEYKSFAYSVSHDLRSPLRSVSGFSEALMSSFSDELSDKAKDYLSRVHNAAERMGELIDDILKLSRISQKDLNVQKVDISNTINELIEIMDNSDTESVTFNIDQDLVVKGDKGLARVLLLNLLSNAIKFSLPKDDPKVEVGKVSKEGKDFIYVKDNGIGFNMKYVDKVFLPFQRLHSNGEVKGNGIGLATVKRIINKHNGDIFIESIEGEGTTVYFNLGVHHESI